MDFFSGITIAIVAATLSSWLTVQRFRRERWWERKAEAYIELVEALHEMGVVPSEYFNEANRARDITEHRANALWASYEAAQRKVWRIADTADFIISSDVLASINKMRNGLSSASDADDFYQHLEEIESAVDHCLKEVKKIGGLELGIKSVGITRNWPFVGHLKARIKGVLSRVAKDK